MRPLFARVEELFYYSTTDSTIIYVVGRCKLFMALESHECLYQGNARGGYAAEIHMLRRV